MLALTGPVIIYAVSNKMVVYDQKTNRQKVYSQHRRDITCFCIKKEDNLIASAEGIKRPHIHIWNVDTLETKNPQLLPCRASTEVPLPVEPMKVS